MSDDKPPREQEDFSHIPTQFIPEDDPIYSEGLIIMFPIVPGRPTEETEPIEESRPTTQRLRERPLVYSACSKNFRHPLSR